MEKQTVHIQIHEILEVKAVNYSLGDICRYVKSPVAKIKKRLDCRDVGY